MTERLDQKQPSLSSQAADRAKAPLPPERLRRAMDEGKVVPFVGAGISMGAKVASPATRMPSYAELLRQMIDLADRDLLFKDAQRRQACLRLIEEGELLHAADILDNEILANSRFPYLRRLLNPLEPQPSDVHELLNILGFPVIITSNYDRILETTIYPRPEVLTYEDSISIPLLEAEGKPFIFKIHGDLTRPETIVLGWSKYQTLNDNEKYEALRLFIGRLLTQRTLLFLGCSLKGTEYSEYFVDYVRAHKGLQPGPHYALLERGSLPQSKQDEWQRRLGVQIIEYDRDEDGGHSQVWEFLASIKPRNQTKPVREKSWETFYRGEERPVYLDLQRSREATASSCRYLTPRIMNALAPPDYIERVGREDLKKFADRVEDFPRFQRETVAAMIARCQTIEERLKEGLELRAVFLAETLDEEVRWYGDLALARFRHALNLQERYPDRLRLRALTFVPDQGEFRKSSFALVFGQPEPFEVDVAIFYASQANTNNFMVHMAQVNTPFVTDRVRFFEQRWSASLSEAATLEEIAKRVR